MYKGNCVCSNSLAPIACLVLLMLITACSSKPHVRLFTDNLSQKDLTRIKEKMSAADIKFSLSKAKYPSAIVNNTMLYTPTRNGNKDIYHIIDVLNTSGFDISWTTIFRVENHSFTANNIGVYLFSDGMSNRQEVSNMVKLNEYGSAECGTQLTLNADASFQVLFDIWDETLGDYRQQEIRGTWQKNTTGEITLRSVNWRTSLEFQRKLHVENQDGERLTTLILVPLKSDKVAVDYLLEPNSEPNINCPYRLHRIS